VEVGPKGVLKGRGNLLRAGGVGAKAGEHLVVHLETAALLVRPPSPSADLRLQRRPRRGWRGINRVCRRRRFLYCHINDRSIQSKYPTKKSRRAAHTGRPCYCSCMGPWRLAREEGGEKKRRALYSGSRSRRTANSEQRKKKEKRIRRWLWWRPKFAMLLWDRIG
jgi:hypothetical protein